jgi:hypothetical protein
MSLAAFPLQDQDPAVVQAAQSLRSVPDPHPGGALSVHHRAATTAFAAGHLLAERRERLCSKPLLGVTESQPSRQRRPPARGVPCPNALHTRPRRSRTMPGVHGGNC